MCLKKILGITAVLFHAQCGYQRILLHPNTPCVGGAKDILHMIQEHFQPI